MKIVERHFLLSLLLLVVGSLTALGCANVIASSSQQSGGASVTGSSPENSEAEKRGVGATILLDAWYNSQKRADEKGNQVYFHYKWNDETDSGYSLLGGIFRSYGAETKTLFVAPTVDNLRDAKVYIIVSPDIPVKNPMPHYMEAEEAEQISEWVKAGGVLMIMENDPPNADLHHLNLLSEKFGIHFNDVLRNHVVNDQFELGKIEVPAAGPIFHDAHTIFMKDTCTILAKAPASPLLTDKGDTIIAVARYGKGTVFATVDPWLYNEYTDGHRLPASYDNYSAAKELVRWILEQIPAR
jgi:unsaturated rhamnogalacturonyl hydrolase